MFCSQVTVYHLWEEGGEKEGGGNAAAGGTANSTAEGKGNRKKTVGTHTSYMSCCLFPGSDNQVSVQFTRLFALQLGHIMR